MIRDFSTQFSCRNPVGMTMTELVAWAESMRDEHGANTKLAGLYLDDEYPSVEVEPNYLQEEEPNASRNQIRTSTTG